MEEHVNTFRKCCCAIQTGINVVDANLWLSALTLEKSMCLPLCIAVIDGSDASTINSVFLASKIIHNLLRETHYTVAIDQNYVQVRNSVYPHGNALQEEGQVNDAILINWSNIGYDECVVYEGRTSFWTLVGFYPSSNMSVHSGSTSHTHNTAIKSAAACT